VVVSEGDFLDAKFTLAVILIIGSALAADD
jgi:hypothetical protein